MWQRQHSKQDVDGSSSQVRRINVDLEFGKFPGRRKQNEKCYPVKMKMMYSLSGNLEDLGQCK